MLAKLTSNPKRETGEFTRYEIYSNTSLGYDLALYKANAQPSRAPEELTPVDQRINERLTSSPAFQSDILKTSGANYLAASGHQ